MFGWGPVAAAGGFHHQGKCCRQMGFSPCRRPLPIDHMLVAQAELDGFFLITADPQLAKFSCQTLW